jgi:hypothetical protein
MFIWINCIKCRQNLISNVVGLFYFRFISHRRSTIVTVPNFLFMAYRHAKISATIMDFQVEFGIMRWKVCVQAINYPKKINFWPFIYQLSNILFAMQMIRIVPIIAFNSSALDKQIFAKLSKPVNLLVLSAAIDVDHCASVKMHRCIRTPIIRSLWLVVENVGKVPTVTDERWIQKWH